MKEPRKVLASRCSHRARIEPKRSAVRRLYPSRGGPPSPLVVATGQFSFTRGQAVGYARGLGGEPREVLYPIEETRVMKTELQESMAAGVFVEFRDPQGHTVGQAIFTPWQARPLPAVGDMLGCAAFCTATGRRRKLSGRVRTRHFELQHDDDGACVWVRMVVETNPLTDEEKLARVGSGGAFQRIEAAQRQSQMATGDECRAGGVAPRNRAPRNRVTLCFLVPWPTLAWPCLPPWRRTASGGRRRRFLRPLSTCDADPARQPFSFFADWELP